MAKDFMSVILNGWCSRLDDTDGLIAIIDSLILMIGRAAIYRLGSDLMAGQLTRRLIALHSIWVAVRLPSRAALLDCNEHYPIT